MFPALVTLGCGAIAFKPELLSNWGTFFKNTTKTISNALPLVPKNLLEAFDFGYLLKRLESA